jgi:hypothetical protein
MSRGGCVEDECGVLAWVIHHIFCWIESKTLLSNSGGGNVN